MPDEAGTTPAGATAEPLLSVALLAQWVREPIADDDPFALQIVWAASVKVRTTCHNTTWTATTIPDPVKLVLVQLAKRAYINDRGIVAEGGLGPIGGDRFLDDYARTLQFLPEELAELEQYGADDTTPANGLGGLTQMQLIASDAPLESDTHLFASEGGVVSDWAIPYLGPDDAWLGRPRP